MKDKPQILSVIVTYNPDLFRLQKLLSVILPQVSFVLIYDNNSVEQNRIIDSQKNDGIQVHGFKDNHGLSYSYNAALKFAIENNYSHLLLLDQDSMPADNLVKILYKGFSVDAQTAVVVPSLIDENAGNEFTVKNEFENVKHLINSGSLFNVEYLRKVGGYDEKLFVDYADFEISYRLRRHNYYIKRSRDAKMLHVLGDGNIKRILFINFYVTNHSVFRRFLISKNRILVYRKYFVYFPFDILKDIGSLIKLFFTIFLFETNKRQKCTAMVRGIYYGFVNR